MDDIVISEKRLEDYIYGYLTNSEFNENIGLCIDISDNDIVKRQFNCGSYGVADIVIFNIERGPEFIFNVDILELKKDKIRSSTFIQAVGYKKGILEFIKKSGFYDCENKWDININIHLIGNGISLSDNFCFIPRCFKDVYLYKYDLDINNGFLLTQQSRYFKKDNKLTTEFKEIVTCLDYRSHDDECHFHHYYKNRGN